MSPLFAAAYKAVILGHEGGYSQHPADRGGETYRGIARTRWPHWGGWDLIDDARAATYFPAALVAQPDLEAAVQEFYRSNFWCPIGGDRLRHDRLAVEMFDSAVNCGVSTASAWLQRALNMLNRRGQLYPDLSVDEHIGPVTLAALDALLHAEGYAMLVRLLNILQGCHYVRLMEGDESQEAFARGWLRRVTL